MGRKTTRGRPRNSNIPMCPDCKQHDVVCNGHDKNGRQRYKCLTCNKTFNERKGTVFYRMRKDEKDIIEALHSYARCMNLSAIAEVKHVRIETVANWITKAAVKCIEIVDILFKDIKLVSMQLDEMWSYVKSKANQQWVWEAIDPVSKLLLGFHLGPWTKKNANRFLGKLRKFIEKVDIITTDGLEHYKELILEVFKESMYAQVIKTRKGKKLQTVDVEVVVGDKEIIEYNARLYGFGKTINTAYIERSNLTSRQNSSRLKRKTLSYSKSVEAFKDYLSINLVYYNFVKIHLSQTLKHKKRTPAMCAGLTSHIWTFRELLTFRE